MTTYRITEGQKKAIERALDTLEDLGYDFERVTETFLSHQRSFDRYKADIQNARGVLNAARVVLDRLDPISPLEELAEQAE